jgi:hypothetical protein
MSRAFLNLIQVEITMPHVAPPEPHAPKPGRKEEARSDSFPHRPKMTRDEARGFLGLRRAAFLLIMSKVHPDHGSSNDFAKQLNAAKAVLMGE